MKPTSKLLAAVALVLATLGIVVAAMAEAGVSKRTTSEAAFRQVATVLTSPRCLNCHIGDDIPRQGDDNHLHTMSVKRGSDGRGTPAMKCANCHQEQNSFLLHGPPGAPGWRLPPPEHRLAWMGLTNGGICRSVRDSNTNGGMNHARLIEHVERDPFVKWAWAPGRGRTKPPLTHEQFVKAWKTWIATGASCPQN